jgi:hypothetical protein
MSAGAGYDADDAIPDAYVAERVRDALAADERVGELGLSVDRRGEALVVRGAVSTTSRKAGVAPVAREVLAQLGAMFEVQDETEVPPTTRPEEEVLG